MTLKELRELRARQAKVIKNLSDTINKANRDFTSDERQQWDRANAEYDRLSTLIEAQERGQRIDGDAGGRGEQLPGREDRDTRGEGQDGRTRKETGDVYVTRDGKRIRALSRNELLSDIDGPAREAEEERLREDGRPLDLGLFIRGCVTKNWKGAEAERRTLSASDLTAGGILVPTALATTTIDKARNKARLLTAGARTIPMDTSTLTLAKVSGDPSLSWRAENELIALTDMEFGGITLSVKSVGCIVPVSRELLEDAPNISALLNNALVQGLALELDRCGLRGQGPGEPMGIVNQDGVQAIAGVGVISYDDFSNAVQKVAESNGTATAAILHPRDLGILDRLKDSQTQPMTPPASWSKLQILDTNQILATEGAGENESSAFCGDFSTMLFGMRATMNMGIDVNAAGSYPSSGEGYAKNQVLIRLVARVDVHYERAEWLVKLTGITPS